MLISKNSLLNVVDERKQNVLGIERNVEFERNIVKVSEELFRFSYSDLVDDAILGSRCWISQKILIDIGKQHFFIDGHFGISQIVELNIGSREREIIPQRFVYRAAIGPCIETRNDRVLLVLNLLDQGLICICLKFFCFETRDLHIDIAYLNLGRLIIVPCRQQNIIAKNHKDKKQYDEINSISDTDDS